MNDTWLLIIFGMVAAYFGLRALRILPTLLRLLAALKSGAVKWPGPIVHDPDSKEHLVRRRLGIPSEHLFSTFMWHTSVVVSASVFSMLMFHINTPQLAAYVSIEWTWQLAGLVLVICSGVLSSRRLDRIVAQVNMLLSDLAAGVEPRQIDGFSAESEFAIEHPLTNHQDIKSETRQAIIQFTGATKNQQDGNSAEALILYQSALRTNPSLHDDARAILCKIAEDCVSSEAGAVYYWLGIHSEYLMDWRQAAVWYEKAAEIYSQIGHPMRESRVHCNLGNVKMQMGDPTAMDEFEKAISLNPRNGTAYLSIARTYYCTSYSGGDRYDLALDAFANAVISDPLTYGPKVISSLRELDYSWKEDLEEITRRVESKRTGESVEEHSA